MLVMSRRNQSNRRRQSAWSRILSSLIPQQGAQSYVHRMDVMSQIEVAMRHKPAMLVGAVMGGSVPWFGRMLAHGELVDAWRRGSWLPCSLVLVVIAGCLAFSALSVRKFGTLAFGDARKAVGFVVALEGVLLVSQGVTSWASLALLVVINAVANGCVLAVAQEATQRRCEADQRRSQTRARNREVRGPSLGAHGTPKSSSASVSSTTGGPAPRRPRLPSFASYSSADVSDAEIVAQWKTGPYTRPTA